jgi:hypothetical protein
MKMSASRPEVTGKRFVSHREAAAMYGVCTKTIDRWVEQGILEPPTVINERKYHKIESLAEVGKISKIAKPGAGERLLEGRRKHVAKGIAAE